MDVLKIIAFLGGIGGLWGIYLNHLNVGRAYNEKTLDRLKQISAEVQADKPDKWWVEQAFESIYRLNFPFGVIQMIVEAGVRNSSLVAFSKLVGKHIVFDPFTLERKFRVPEWNNPVVVRRRLAYRLGLCVSLLVISFGLLIWSPGGIAGWAATIVGFMIEGLALWTFVSLARTYQRHWVVYQNRNFGRLNNWFIHRFRRQIPLDL